MVATWVTKIPKRLRAFTPFMTPILSPLLSPSPPMTSAALNRENTLICPMLLFIFLSLASTSSTVHTDKTAAKTPSINKMMTVGALNPSSISLGSSTLRISNGNEIYPLMVVKTYYRSSALHTLLKHIPLTKLSLNEPKSSLLQPIDFRSYVVPLSRQKLLFLSAMQSQQKPNLLKPKPERVWYFCRSATLPLFRYHEHSLEIKSINKQVKLKNENFTQRVKGMICI